MWLAGALFCAPAGCVGPLRAKEMTDDPAVAKMWALRKRIESQGAVE